MNRRSPLKRSAFVLAVTLNFDLLTLKSNKLHLCPQLHPSCKVDEIPTSGMLRLIVFTHGHMYSPKTECFRRLITCEDVKMARFFAHPVHEDGAY